jgi:hypothetical protein
MDNEKVTGMRLALEKEASCTTLSEHELTFLIPVYEDAQRAIRPFLPEYQDVFDDAAQHLEILRGYEWQLLVQYTLDQQVWDEERSRQGKKRPRPLRNRIYPAFSRNEEDRRDWVRRHYGWPLKKSSVEHVKPQPPPHPGCITVGEILKLYAAGKPLRPHFAAAEMTCFRSLERAMKPFLPRYQHVHQDATRHLEVLARLAQDESEFVGDYPAAAPQQ